MDPTVARPCALREAWLREHYEFMISRNDQSDVRTAPRPQNFLCPRRRLSPNGKREREVLLAVI